MEAREGGQKLGAGNAVCRAPRGRMEHSTARIESRRWGACGGGELLPQRLQGPGGILGRDGIFNYKNNTDAL